ITFRAMCVTVHMAKKELRVNSKQVQATLTNANVQKSRKKISNVGMLGSAARRELSTDNIAAYMSFSTVHVDTLEGFWENGFSVSRL
uniref:Uncharacterized protein n=1 Tax=Amphiprion ocellaris TaxID=80972 RepID=A0AAQ5ZLE9_AMPOC